MAGELISIILIVSSYLLGSIPFTYLIGKIFFKVDIRSQGSGNVGGANAIRIYGRKFGMIGGFLDIMKGYIAIILTKAIINGQNIDSIIFTDNIVIVLAGFFAIFGHCFPIYLRFQGGKGGATTAGAILAIDPMTFLILVVFWIIIVGSTRFTSLGNLLAIITIPYMFNYRMSDTAYEIFGYALVALIYFKHRTNISRLLTGEERKFGEKEVIN
ncbi:MAG: glycerol-3-phosphate 1-O-acyltransferase PlsY [Candidatus Kariarchaeaceae archaeon]